MSPDPQRGSPIEGEKLDLRFPCPWTYTIFGPDEVLLREAVAAVVGDARHTLELSRESRTGKYRSMHLEVVVRDDEERLSIFRTLHGHPDVAYVL